MAEITTDAQAIVAAVLTAVRIMKQGTTNGASSFDAYEKDYEKMLDRVQNPHSRET